ncbi:MAG: hypothetical protein ACI4KI_07390 [Candidatus Fimenecus sp.]
MKKTKMIISIVVVCIIVWSTVVPSFAYSPYEVLLQKGFSPDFLKVFSDAQLLKICNKIGTDHVFSINSTTIHLKEGNTDNQTYGAISETSMDLSVNAIVLTDGQIFTGVLVIVGWEWLDGKPVIRQTDSISVNWDASVFNLKSDSFYSADMYRIIHSPEDWSISKEYNRPAEANQGGVGFYTSLMDDYTNYSVANGGVAMFNLNTNSSCTIGNSHTTSINVQYVHNRSVFIPSLSFSKTGTSVSIGSIALFTDSASDTVNVTY